MLCGRLVHRLTPVHDVVLLSSKQVASSRHVAPGRLNLQVCTFHASSRWLAAKSRPQAVYASSSKRVAKIKGDYERTKKRSPDINIPASPSRTSSGQTARDTLENSPATTHPESAREDVSVSSEQSEMIIPLEDITTGDPNPSSFATETTETIPSTISPHNPTLRPSRLPPRTDYNALLSRTTTPIQLYTAPSHLRYNVLSYTSLLFAGWQVQFNLSTYLSLSHNIWLTAVGGFVVTIWAGVGVWFALAPAKLVRSIRAVPSQLAAENPVGHGPMLEVEVAPILPWSKNGPVIPVSAREVTRDVEIAGTVRRMVEGQANEKLRWKFGKRFLRWTRAVLFDMVNVFSRRNMVYIDLPGRGQWKVDLPGKQNLGTGMALEEVLEFDPRKKKFSRKLFS